MDFFWMAIRDLGGTSRRVSTRPGAVLAWTRPHAQELIVAPSVESAITVIGGGSIGGKAQGLVSIEGMLREGLDRAAHPGLEVAIPTTCVLATEFFDDFMQRNALWDLACSETSDHRIAHAFQQAEIPPRWAGELWRLSGARRSPLAVRSSSLLEDAMYRPFAGVYATKMVPNQAPDDRARFQGLVEAVKFVLASTFFQDARRYLGSVGRVPRDEKMAVIVQDVVGARYGDRFYPTISGVGRSWNFYPALGARPEDGVVDLALGLGKTIVDGGKTWSYSPAAPSAPPPYNNVGDIIRSTQTSFWAVHVGTPPPHDPLREEEHLVKKRLAEADYDDTLRFVASTYDRQSDRLIPSVGLPGPRVIDFAPTLVLGSLALNPLIRDLLALCKRSVGCDVEIEFAVVLDRKKGTPARLGFLQVRPMVVDDATTELLASSLEEPEAVIASETSLGNGTIEDLHDIVYVDPAGFDPARSGEVAQTLERWNAELAGEGRPYLLLGFGRWGTSDPWYGIPCVWSQISGARVIVEVAREGMETEMSQGSHFFHNVTSFKVFYLSVTRRGRARIDWEWLLAQTLIRREGMLAHARTEAPVRVVVDGRSGRGAVFRG
jgi:hypothetical protein